jgi:hypothetical protein
MSDEPSVATRVVRRGGHRGARLLTLVTLTVVISTVEMLNAGAASAETENQVEGRVLDTSASVTPDPCPDLVATVTGNPRSGPPTSEQVVGCLARAEVEGSRPPVAGAPCAGVHVSGHTSVLVRDGRGQVLAHSPLGKGHRSADGTHCVFAFSVRVPTANTYSFSISDTRAVSATFAVLRQSHWRIGLTA